MRTLPLATLCLALVTTACAGRQDTRIPDTPTAQAVLAVIDSYQTAMEQKDVGRILELASADYHEDMGTSDVNDDVGFHELKSKIAGDFEKVRALRLDIEILKLELDEEEVSARVEYRYDLRYQLALPSGDRWHNSLDVNEMRLRKEETGWRVVRGL